MIYVPDLDYACYYVPSEGVIRAYEQVPRNNIDVNYRDYYINNSYLYKDGEQSFGSYSTIPICLPNDIITDNFLYRNDIAYILITFLILSIFLFYIPIKIFLRLFRRFQ